MIDIKEQVEHLLSVHENGDSIETLWKKCTTFEYKLELISAVNHCLKNHLLHKCGQIFTKTPSNLTIEDSIRAAVRKVRKSRTAKPEACKNFGKLQPDTPLGSVAYALMFHTAPISVEALASTMRSPPRTIRAQLNSLHQLGYAFKRSLKDGNGFYWSENFDYPFPKVVASDKTILK